MSRSRMIFVAAFVLVLCAGVVVGRLWNYLPPPHQGSAGNPPSWFADQLNLQADQQRKIDAIWGEIKPQMEKSMEQRQALDRERDQAIQELLTPAEWTAYDKIIEEFRNKRSDLDKQRHQLIQDANEKSMALLDDAQKKKWDAFRNAHEHERRGTHGAASPTTRGANP